MKIELVKIEKGNGNVFMHIREVGRTTNLETFCVATSDSAFPEEEEKALKCFLNWKLKEVETVLDTREI